MRSQLRSQIYAQIQGELAQLNKMYPTQKYVVHQLNFNENDSGPQPMRNKMMLAVAAESSDNTMPVTVANKITMNANVDLVSVNQ